MRAGKHAIVLAAGRGDRLTRGFSFPKPLKRVNNVPLLVRVLTNLERAGIESCSLVLGYLGELVEQTVRRYPWTMTLDIVQLGQLEQGIAGSLRCAGETVVEPTLITMGDVLCSTSLVQSIIETSLSEVDRREIVLSVDQRPGRCFDLANATKVFVHANGTIQVGRQLDRYQGIFAGVAIARPGFFELLREESLKGTSRELYTIIHELSLRSQVGLFDIGESRWIDVDTPEAHTKAELMVTRYGEGFTATSTLPPPYRPQSKTLHRSSSNAR